ncbi:hypothetical protein COOONC_25743 [Cooperia oncophora]
MTLNALSGDESTASALAGWYLRHFKLDYVTTISKREYCKPLKLNLISSFELQSAHGADTYKSNLIKAIQILKDNLPRTIVSITGMMDIEILRPVDKRKLFCVGLH